VTQAPSVRDLPSGLGEACSAVARVIADAGPRRAASSTPGSIGTVSTSF